MIKGTKGGEPNKVGNTYAPLEKARAAAFAARETRSKAVASSIMSAVTESGNVFPTKDTNVNNIKLGKIKGPKNPITKGKK